jgi:hypothetical protein
MACGDASGTTSLNAPFFDALYRSAFADPKVRLACCLLEL